MCIGVLAEGHLRIVLMLEAVHAHAPSASSAIQFDQSFDLLVQNTGKQSIQHLTIIHPRKVLGYDKPETGGPARFLGGEPNQSYGDRMFRTPPVRHADGTGTFRIRGVPGGASDSEYEEVTVRVECPRLVVHPLLARHDKAARQLIESPGVPSLLQASLSKPLASGERAMLRLSFQNVHMHPISAQTVGVPGERSGRLTIEAYETWCPEFVWLRLYGRLQKGDLGLSPEDASQLRQQLFYDGLFHNTRTVYAMEHRLAIVTNSSCYLASSQPSPTIRFWQVRGLMQEPDVASKCDHWAHIWRTGPTADPTLDPVFMAQQVIRAVAGSSSTQSPWIYAPSAGLLCGGLAPKRLRQILDALVELEILQYYGDTPLVGLHGTNPSLVDRASQAEAKVRSATFAEDLVCRLGYTDDGSLESLPFWGSPFTFVFSLARLSRGRSSG